MSEPKWVWSYGKALHLAQPMGNWPIMNPRLLCGRGWSSWTNDLPTDVPRCKTCEKREGGASRG